MRKLSDLCKSFATVCIRPWYYLTNVYTGISCQKNIFLLSICYLTDFLTFIQGVFILNLFIYLFTHRLTFPFIFVQTYYT